MPYRKFNKLIYSLILFTLMFSNIVQSDPQVISIHKYSLFKSKIHFASSIYKLSKSDDIYTFQIVSSTDGIFKLKKDDRSEISKFKKNKEYLQPISYSFTRIKKDKEDNILSIFTPEKNYAYSLINDKKVEHFDLLYPLDRLSVQIDFQNKMKNGIFEKDYNIVDKGRIRKYSFSLFGDDIIDTIFGKTNTIVIKKTIKNNKRSTLTWYAVDYNYIPVRIEQYRKDSLKFIVTLEEISD